MPKDTGAVHEDAVEERSRVDIGLHGQGDAGGLLATSPGDLEAAISVLCLRLEELEREADRGPDTHDDANRAMARETLERHVPLADRMGLQALRKHLENASLRVLDPLVYRELAHRLAPVQTEDEMCLVLLQAGVERLLRENGIAGTVQGRIKSLYSIYLKMRRTNCPLGSILDRIGLRVIVPSIVDCYHVLDLLQARFRPVPGTLDDYIAHPKDNGYRSLHICVYPVPHLLYKPVEIQIRTVQMHYHAQFGPAAHWRYKNEEETRPEGGARLTWLRGLLEQREPAPDHAAFIQELYHHLFGDRPPMFHDDRRPEEVFVPATVDDV